MDNENCTGIITAYQPQVADWSEEEPYKTVYKFCFRTIVSTFLPFLLSLYFNMKIVSRLQQQITGARLFRFATSEHRVCVTFTVSNDNIQWLQKNIRSTTRMLAMITTTYLACNILSVFVASVEFVNKELLMTPEIRPLYTYSSDLISLLTVFSCASRLPIYYFCNVSLFHVWIKSYSIPPLTFVEKDTKKSQQCFASTLFLRCTKSRTWKRQ